MTASGGVERVAATAGRNGVGVANFETRTLNSFDKINFCSFHQLCTLVVHVYVNPAVGPRNIITFRVLFENHTVLVTRATAGSNENSQTICLFLVLCHELLYTVNS